MSDLTSRQQDLLTLVVEEYIRTASPVGSTYLVDSAGLDISGATVRNELRELEEQGFLTHPHTSAGRMPTEHGFHFYVSEGLGKIKAAKKDVSSIKARLDAGQSKADKIKMIARHIADEAASAVIVVLERKNVYYTGISNLFAQPEFRDYAHTVRVSAIFDECESQLDRLFDTVDTAAPIVKIGQDNPLGKACSIVGTRLSKESLLLILGPMRMNYRKHVSLIHALLRAIKE